MSNFKEDLQRISAFVFDIDGVLSQQTIMVDENGGPMRTINLRDGYALQFAIKKGYKIGIISGGNSEALRRRLNILGIDNVFLKVSDKKVVFNEFLSIADIQTEEVLYMGDDIPDFEVMKMAGVAVCPADADSEIKQISVYISDKNGGEGCVRDVIEQVLRLHGVWMDGDAFKW